MADDALAAPLAAVHHRRELRLLQLVGLALRLPAGRLHRLEPGARGADLARAVAAQRKSLLVLALAGNLAVLGYFKYYDFFVTSSDNLLSVVGLDMPLEVKSIVLPVGISFYTFMAISYVVDVYRGEFEPTTLDKFAVYLSFFPHLVAGPIVRPGELLPQLETPRDPRRVDTSRAFYLIATGLFKKVVIANYLAASIVDEVFAAPGTALVARDPDRGLRATPSRSTRDFSGYTDIAIGIAPAARVRVPAELRLARTRPTSLQDFWRRWHITLSRWLRDYVYIPLGGNRGKRAILTYRNLMLTMLIGGLWHGAAWTFVVWGALHGIGLVAERYRQDRHPELVGAAADHWRRWRARLLTFHFVCFAWIFFRASSFDDAWAMITGLFTRWGEASPLVTGGVLLAIAVGIGSQYLPARIPRLVMARFSRLPVLGQATVLAFALTLTSVMGPEGVAPFIYFQF